MAKVDGSYLKELAKIEQQHLVIIDNFGLQNRITLMEIIDDRHNKASVIITSQLLVNKLYHIIGKNAIADTILDRLIHQAHRIPIVRWVNQRLRTQGRIHAKKKGAEN